MKKSQFVQFVLALFGPLGLFYSSSTTAWFCIVLALISGVLTFGIGALVVWALSPIVGFLSVSHYNATLAHESRTPKDLTKPAGPAQQVDPASEQDSVECPYCAERIKRKAVICRHCQRDVSSVTRQAAGHTQQSDQVLVPGRPGGESG